MGSLLNEMIARMDKWRPGDNQPYCRVYIPRVSKTLERETRSHLRKTRRYPTHLRRAYV